MPWTSKFLPCVAVLGVVAFSPAAAQVAPPPPVMIGTPAFQSVIPFDYRRGRNESVLDRQRPLFQPLGIPAGGFTLYPSLSVTTGYDNNVYQAPTNKTGDGLVTVNPALNVQSNWSRHSLAIDGAGTITRYFKQSPRDENGWTAGAQGRLDVGGDDSVTLGARTSKIYESQFSGSALQNVRSSVPIQMSVARAVADFRFSRLRTVVSGDYTDFAYQTVTASDGTPFSQNSRNRGIARAIGHAEYGLTPDTGVFGELIYTNTSYRNELFPGIPNRSLNQVQALAGLSTDLSELLRGSIGVGYINRNYDAARYRTVAGVSFNGKIEYFPSQLTTVTLSGRREVDDASLIGTSGFFATNAALRIDHELLRNLLINIGADLEFDDYREFSGRATSFRTSAGGQFLVNHQLSINGQLFYGRRTTNSPLAGPELSQAKALIGISYHP